MVFEDLGAHHMFLYGGMCSDAMYIFRHLLNQVQLLSHLFKLPFIETQSKWVYM